MPRFRSLALLLASALLATALVACGDDSDGGGGAGDPQAVIDEATLEGVESGVLDLSLAVNARGQEGGDVDVSLSGPFQAAASEAEKPQFDLAADVSGSIAGEKLDFEGGLVLLPNSAYVNYEGTEYEVDPTTFGFVEGALEQAQREAGGEEAGGAAACQEAVAGLEVGNFMDNLSEEGGAEVGGTSTTKVSGDLDVSEALDSLVDVAEDPACSAQAGPIADQLPSESEIDEAKSEVGDAVKTAHVDVYVGEDDIVRQITARLDLEPSGDSEKVEVEFELKLTEVNEEQEIAAPGGAKPLSDLFLKLGVNPTELIGVLQGEESKGIEELIEGLGDAAGAAVEGGGGDSGGSRRAYLRCLGEARTPVDLQQCARLTG